MDQNKRCPEFTHKRRVRAIGPRWAGPDGARGAGGLRKCAERAIRKHYGRVWPIGNGLKVRNIGLINLPLSGYGRTKPVRLPRRRPYIRRCLKGGRVERTVLIDYCRPIEGRKTFRVFRKVFFGQASIMGSSVQRASFSERAGCRAGSKTMFHG